MYPTQTPAELSSDVATVEVKFRRTLNAMMVELRMHLVFGVLVWASFWVKEMGFLPVYIGWMVPYLMAPAWGIMLVQSAIAIVRLPNEVTVKFDQQGIVFDGRRFDVRSKVCIQVMRTLNTNKFMVSLWDGKKTTNVVKRRHYECEMTAKELTERLPKEIDQSTIYLKELIPRIF